jgi:hypothetical protein
MDYFELGWSDGIDYVTDETGAIRIHTRDSIRALPLLLHRKFTVFVVGRLDVVE